MHRYTLERTDKYSDFMVLTLDHATEADKLQFTPGQYITVGFKNSTKTSPVRCFSIASAPNENNIRIAMRESGIYTNKLGELHPGTEMLLQGPFGDFGINHLDSQDIVMLAAGIGITPFMGILRSLKDQRLDRNILLVYSSRNDSSIPFFEELQDIAKTNPKITVIHIAAKGTSNPSKNIYVGRTDDKMLSRILRNNFQDKNYMICGPSPFMEDADQILLSNSVNPDKIQIESFKQGNTLTLGSSYSIAAATYVMTFLVLMLGVGVVGSRDLRHYVAKIEAQNVNTAPVQTINNENENESSRSESDYSNPSANTTTAPTNTSNQTYRPPVTSVS